MCYDKSLTIMCYETLTSFVFKTSLLSCIQIKYHKKTPPFFPLRMFVHKLHKQLTIKHRQN